MATFKTIAKKDHFIRRAMPKWVLRDGDEIIGFDQEIFRYKTDAQFIAKHGSAETSLSINHVEYFTGSAAQQLEQVLADYKDGLPSVDLGKCHFTKLNIGDFLETCDEHNSSPRIVHDGRNTKSHGGITQLKQEDQILLEKLSKVAFVKRFEHKYSKTKKIPK